jgi:hypothetical protein
MIYQDRGWKERGDWGYLQPDGRLTLVSVSACATIDGAAAARLIRRIIGSLRTGRAGTVKRDQPEVRPARSVFENTPVAAMAAKLHLLCGGRTLSRVPQLGIGTQKWVRG